MLRTPAGSPASAKISPQSRPPETGDHSDGFRTTVLPSASGAAIERAERISATFHGAIAPTTPTGRRRPIANAPVSDGITSPSGAYASAAAWRRRPGTKCIWNIPIPNVQPVSRASRDTTSSWRLSSTSAALRKIPCRAAGGVSAQAGAAAAATSIARRASSRDPAATSTRTSPVNGSRSSKVRPPSASAHSPPMKSRFAVLSLISVAISFVSLSPAAQRIGRLLLPCPAVFHTSRHWSSMRDMQVRRRRRADAGT